jgi:hypothetical protein
MAELSLLLCANLDTSSATTTSASGTSGCVGSCRGGNVAASGLRNFLFHLSMLGAKRAVNLVAWVGLQAEWRSGIGVRSPGPARAKFPWEVFLPGRRQLTYSRQHLLTHRRAHQHRTLAFLPPLHSCTGPRSRSSAVATLASRMVRRSTWPAGSTVRPAHGPRPVVAAPEMPTGPDGSRQADYVLYGGLVLPPGEATAWCGRPGRSFLPACS